MIPIQKAKVLQGQVALITGASSGIGAAVARKLAGKGLRCIITARRAKNLALLATEIQAKGGEAIAITCDLADDGARQALVQQVAQQYGTPRVLVNNAGLGWYGYYEKMPWDVVKEVVEINVLAMAHLTTLLLPAMKRAKQGHIINIGSIAGGFPNQGVAVYSASKAFMDAFTTSLHRELVHSGVHVGVIRPGAVKTGFSVAAAAKAGGGHLPTEKGGISALHVADAVWSVLLRPRRVVYVPWYMRSTLWLENTLGWLIDRLGPLLLQRAEKTGV